jgi:hypothetical protein
MILLYSKQAIRLLHFLGIMRNQNTGRSICQSLAIRFQHYLWIAGIALSMALDHCESLALAGPAIPPPPPISMPVWSLASPFGDDETSMNIVTFATPVSVAPPKLWVISLYTNTKTRQAFLDSNVGVLQLLTPSLKHIVPILGKRSGYEEGYSKQTECANIGHEWIRGSSSEGNSIGLVPSIGQDYQ